MTLPAWIFGLSLLAQTSTASISPKLGRDLPFSVTADRLVAERAEGQYLAEGNVSVRRAGAVLFGDRVRFDQTTGMVHATGNVTIVEGNSVLRCEAVSARVPELIGGLQRAELRIKSSLPPSLLAELSADALLTHGEDELIVEAGVIVRRSKRAFDLQDSSFTACSCAEGEAPTWRIGASRASVDLDSGAWLSWPVIYAKNVPIFALPALYLPLGNRRTGLLMPRPSYGVVTGFGIRQPLFLVMGRSLDATVEPQYFSRRGPGLDFEFRYAPTASTRGQVRMAGLLDYGTFEVLDGASSPTWGKRRVDPLGRLAIRALHRTTFESGAIVADVNVVGDPIYTSDFARSFLARQAEFTRSRIMAEYHVAPGFRAAVSAQLLQDLRGLTYAGAAPDPREVFLLDFGAPGARDVRYRILELRADAFPHRLLEGPVPLQADATVRIDGYAAGNQVASTFLRADLRPALRAPIRLLGALDVEASAALRATAWTGTFAGASETTTRLAPIGRLSLATDIQRDFESVRHSIRPRLEYVIIPGVVQTGSPIFFAFDEVDLFGRASQVRAQLETDFTTSRGNALAEFSAFVGYDFDPPFAPEPGLPGRGLSELVLDAAFPLLPSTASGALRVSGRAAIDLKSADLRELRASLSLATDPLSLSATYGHFSETMPTYLFMASEEIAPSTTYPSSGFFPFEEYAAFSTDAKRETKPWSGFDGLALSTELRPLSSLALGFAINLSFGESERLLQLYGSENIVRNTVTSLRFSSDCDCFDASLQMVTARDQQGLPAFNLTIDLARLGQTKF